MKQPQALCCSLIGILVTGASNPCTEIKVKSCDQCIAIPGCGWCSDPKYANNPNIVIPRCNLPETLLSEGCPPESISNPHSGINVTRNFDLSNVGESAVAKAIQFKPQQMTIKLRPGDPVQVNLTFKQAEDYPVDLYYLLDLSHSMKDDLERLRKLGKELGESMQKITRDFRLGFGSFVDKTVMPYISTVPSKLKNPCSTNEPCAPAYSFHNDLPLTSQIEKFVSSVENVTYSSNLDSPEGGFDAMMQAIVCQNQINWRKDATHLLVFSTDAGFHYAGDGKLGGIVQPNDGLCYLNSKGEYTHADKMDYPSVGHLMRKITEYNIQPIFAVTYPVLDLYKNLQMMIPKSVVGELSGDSSNIIGLIDNAYNDLKGQVVLELDSPKEMAVSDKRATCLNESMESLKCERVKLGDAVNFTFTLSSDTCLSKPVNVTVSPYGYNEKVIITLLPQCQCECDVVETVKANNCSGHGTYNCGACVCDPGFSGLDCSCNRKDGEGRESYLVNCTDQNTGVVCGDRGECQCGQCICTQYPEKRIDGKYCECDNTTCDRVLGKVCNDKGNCNCRKCECNPGWSGNACECIEDDSLCYDKSEDAIDPSNPCNGNGVCQCGVCNCSVSQSGGKYRGQFCKTKPIVFCDIHRSCIQCLAFGGGVYNTTKVCKENCQRYNVTKLGKDEGGSYKQECRFTDPLDDCTYSAYIEEIDGVIMVDVEGKNCQSYTSPTYIIIGIIAAIVGIGLALLLIWKLLTSIKDAREFKKFQKESQNPKWQGGENPMFKSATSKVSNPMFTEEKPSTST